MHLNDSSDEQLEILNPDEPASAIEEATEAAATSLERETEQNEEYDLLTEANHAHHLFESYKDSALSRRTLAHVQKANGGSTRDTSYSVWVNSKDRDSPSFSVLQFWHELVIRELWHYQRY